MKKNFTRLLWTVLSLFFISFHSKAQSGQALNFVPDQYATLPANILDGITDNFTIEAWVYWRGGPNWQRVFDIGTSTTNYMYLSVSGDVGGGQEIVFGWAMNGHPERRATSAFSMPIGVWTHIAITVDYSDPLYPKAYMFVNGVRTGPTFGGQGMLDLGDNTPYYTSGMGTNLTNSWLGRSEFAGAPFNDAYFNGAIDELRI